MKRFTAFIVAFLLLANFTGPASAITIPEENEVAKKFMKMVEEQKMILHDPCATALVEQVGRHLMASVPPQVFDYHFYVIDDDIFNAFASPGANIFFYRGLITELESIDELAGIMAHEIAHASSRHVSESIDRSKYVGIGSMAGMLAGIILGTTGSGETGAAVMQGSLAAGQTAMLAFTRENETEADEKAVMFLNKSCFHPEGLLTGLQKIRASDFRGTENIPDYVKTHPGTAARIAHTENILSAYTPPDHKPRCKTLPFDMVKYRLLGLYADLDQTFHSVSRQLEDHPDKACLHYCMGLLYDRKFSYAKAMEHLKKALAINVYDPMILVEMARIYIDNDHPQKALQILEGIESDEVLGTTAQFQTARALMETGELDKAGKKFQNIIRDAEKTFPKSRFYQARVLSQQGDVGGSHYQLGLYYHKEGNLKTAGVHLRKAVDLLQDSKKKEKARELLTEIEKKSFQKQLMKR